jgi:hypothetical protein
MADRRRNDILVIFVEVRVLLELAERLGDVSGDRWFFRNDKNFTHAIGKLLSCPTPVAQLKFYFNQNYFAEIRTRTALNFASSDAGLMAQTTRIAPVKPRPPGDKKTVPSAAHGWCSR